MPHRAGKLPQDKVHFIGDDPMVLCAVSRLLRLNGFNVREYASVGTFVETYRAEPGCVLVDVAMPDMDGLALQAYLLAHGGPPIVFLSGIDSASTRSAAMQAGAVDFLQKPVDEAQLVGAVHAALMRDAQARSRPALKNAIEGQEHGHIERSNL